jgi:hypothetical protein
VIRLLPPLTIDEGLLDEGLQTLDDGDRWPDGRRAAPIAEHTGTTITRHTTRAKTPERHEETPGFRRR